jgi:hypothetical protein
MVSGIQLVVQGDDVGMCHAVNEAVVTALCAPEARAVVERRGIELVAVGEL